MALSVKSPLFASAMYGASSSPCASPATSTDSRGDEPTNNNSACLSKLPGLQFAISHRRTELRLPSLSGNNTSNHSSRVFDSSNSENIAMNHALQLSMPQCETPHYLPGVPMCPETSPTDKKTASMGQSTDGSAKDLDANGKKRKKGTRRGTLNAEAKNVLKAWMFSPEHFAHPYPSEEEKEELASEAGIEVKQLSNWFTNARKRLWQPVLRQSGVEVKNFLSTGRGGPRGNKLDVPPNLQHLIELKEQDELEVAALCAPFRTPASPSPSQDSAAMSSPLISSTSAFKRSWSEMHSSPAPSTMPMSSVHMDEVAPKKKKSAPRKRSKDSSTKKDEAQALTKNASQLSHELRLALSGQHPLANSATRPTPTSPVSSAIANVSSFQELEILAAASLIGLHRQPYQSVH